VIVSDTNLIAYLLIGGTHTAAARAVFQRDPWWSAPLLWRSEFRNILANYLRRGELDVVGALRIQSKAEELMAGREHVVQSSRVLQLAADSGCSAYDCEFVALAELLGVRLVTSDSGVVQSFPNIAATPEAFTSSAT